MSSLQRTKEILNELIGFQSVSADSNLEIIGFLEDHLKALGARVEIFADDTGKKANLFATLGPDKKGGIVLSGHSDVVPVADQDWSSDPFKMTERDARLYGRGSCDMKGFIACSLVLAEQLAADRLDAPVHFSFTHDEETGCLGAQAMLPQLEDRGYRPALAIIGEPTDMQIIEGHKGCCEYTTHFTGLPGHGSLPHKGVNAAEYAARFITKLIALREEMAARTPEGSCFEPPHTTMNIGCIRGGVAHNVIASNAEIDWEFRPVNDADFYYFKTSVNSFIDRVLLPEMRAVYDRADIRTDIISEVAGLVPEKVNAARALVMALTGANTAGLVAFGTEAGLFQKLGISAVVCGPGSIEQAHKADEYVSLEQLSACLAMLRKLGQKLSA